MWETELRKRVLRRHVTQEEAVAESERNLGQQLAIDPAQRAPGVSSYALGVHPNPRLWKYRWQIFVLPARSSHRDKTCTLAMPRIGTAAFLKRLAWFKENRIVIAVANTRQRREHDLWDPDLIAGEVLAPRYKEDPDEVADGGHK